MIQQFRRQQLKETSRAAFQNPQIQQPKEQSNQETPILVEQPIALQDSLSIPEPAQDSKTPQIFKKKASNVTNLQQSLLQFREKTQAEEPKQPRISNVFQLEAKFSEFDEESSYQTAKSQQRASRKSIRVNDFRLDSELPSNKPLLTIQSELIEKNGKEQQAFLFQKIQLSDLLKKPRQIIIDLRYLIPDFLFDFGPKNQYQGKKEEDYGYSGQQGQIHYTQTIINEQNQVITSEQESKYGTSMAKPQVLISFLNKIKNKFLIKKMLLLTKKKKILYILEPFTSQRVQVVLHIDVQDEVYFMVTKFYGFFAYCNSKKYGFSFKMLNFVKGCEKKQNFTLLFKFAIAKLFQKTSKLNSVEWMLKPPLSMEFQSLMQKPIRVSDYSSLFFSILMDNRLLSRYFTIFDFKTAVKLEAYKSRNTMIVSKLYLENTYVSQQKLRFFVKLDLILIENKSKQISLVLSDSEVRQIIPAKVQDFLTSKNVKLFATQIVRFLVPNISFMQIQNKVIPIFYRKKFVPQKGVYTPKTSKKTPVIDNCKTKIKSLMSLSRIKKSLHTKQLPFSQALEMRTSKKQYTMQARNSSEKQDGSPKLDKRGAIYQSTNLPMPRQSTFGFSQQFRILDNKNKVQNLKYYQNELITTQLQSGDQKKQRFPFLREKLCNERIIVQMTTILRGQFYIFTVSRDVLLGFWSLKVYVPKSGRNFICQLGNEDILGFNNTHFKKIFNQKILFFIENPHHQIFKSYKLFSERVNMKIDKLQVQKIRKFSSAVNQLRIRKTQTLTPVDSLGEPPKPSQFDNQIYPILKLNTAEQENAKGEFSQTANSTTNQEPKQQEKLIHLTLPIVEIQKGLSKEPTTSPRKSSFNILHQKVLKRLNSTSGNKSPLNFIEQLDNNESIIITKFKKFISLSCANDNTFKLQTVLLSSQEQKLKYSEVYIWSEILAHTLIEENNDKFQFSIVGHEIKAKEYLLNKFIKLESIPDCQLLISTELCRMQKKLHIKKIETQENYNAQLKNTKINFLVEEFPVIKYLETQFMNFTFEFFDFSQNIMKVSQISIREILYLYIADGFYQTNYMNARLNYSDFIQLANYFQHKLVFGNLISILNLQEINIEPQNSDKVNENALKKILLSQKLSKQSAKHQKSLQVQLVLDLALKIILTAEYFEKQENIRFSLNQLGQNSSLTAIKNVHYFYSQPQTSLFVQKINNTYLISKTNLIKLCRFVQEDLIIEYTIKYNLINLESETLFQGRRKFQD